MVKAVTIDGIVVTEIEMRDSLARKFEQGLTEHRISLGLPDDAQEGVERSARLIAIDATKFVFELWGDQDGA